MIRTARSTSILAGTMLVATTLATAPTAAATSQDQQPREAIDVLQSIEVADDGSMDGYDRDTDFGGEWTDTDGNGCDTRDDIMARDLDDETLEIGADGCSVEAGSTTGAYTGETIETTGDGTSIHIEHVVAAGQAWRNGADDWSQEKRKSFYQDPANLMIADAGENMSKSDEDVTEYMPPNAAAHCQFVGTTVYVKAKYDLAMNPDEHQMIAEVLDDPACEGTPAAPAASLYSEGWETAEAPAAGGDEQSPVAAGADNITGGGSLSGVLTNPAVLGIGAAVLVVLGALLFFSGGRRLLSRTLKTTARRTVRSALRN